jgi:putative ABC transport system permease protein
VVKALGAPQSTILGIFVAEAGVLSLAGAALGVVLAYAAIAGVTAYYPALPMVAPPWAVLSAVALALVIGVLFGVLPARRAAALDPIAALSRR